MAKIISSLPKAAPRIIKIDGSALGIITYDIDNGYPQRMKSLINACSTAKQSCSLLSDYTVGQGFKVPEFYKSIINEDENKPLTPDLLLRLSSDDKSKFRGHAFHVNYNALYQISSINYVNFEDVRIGAKENAGKLCVHNDWYNDGTFGKYKRKDDITVFHPFNPKPEIIDLQVEEAGGWENYKGQLYYFSEDYNTYPLSSIDEVLESVETEIESDKTTKNNLKNNFQLKAIWKEKGKFEDDIERSEFNEEVRKFLGSDGNPICVVEVEGDGEASNAPEITTIPNSLNDKLFAYSDEKARSKIYRAFRQPAILHSDYMGTNGYNRDQLRDSMEYYTNYTHPNRIYFEELFTRVFDLFHENINPKKDYSIEPLKTLSNESTQTDGTTNI